MAALAPPNPPPVALPAQPTDPHVLLPAPPVSPPTIDNVFSAINFRQHVEMSISERPANIQCTPNDRLNAILYEHAIITQAATAAAPQAVAPPWIQQIQAGIHQILGALHADIVPDLKRLINQRRGDGVVIQYEIVPFINGDNPTQPPHNLPYLDSVNAIENLDGNQLVGYITGYGVVPPAAADPAATNHLQKQTLKRLVGVSLMS